MQKQEKILTLEDIDNFDFESYYAAKKLRHDRPWVYDIIRVLWGAPKDGVSMDFLCRNLWKIRDPSGLPTPKEFRATVQSALNQHTAQSSVWTGNSEDDLFHSPLGKGSGTWAVHRQRAIAWLNKRDLPDA